MLAELQQQLSDIYQVDRAYDIRDYLITDPTLANCIRGHCNAMPQISSYTFSKMGWSQNILLLVVISLFTKLSMK